MYLKVLINLIVVVLLLINNAKGNKYSESANVPKKKSKTEFSPQDHFKELRQLDNPFRMNKINLVWLKAKHRLTDAKLQSLFSDLKIQDKEEIAFKHFKSNGKDEAGLEEARLRKKFKNIMYTYDLIDYLNRFDNNEVTKPIKDTDNYVVKNLFKDKRLNQLWAKAEVGGFSDIELKTLKEEFEHHQDKIDEYMSLLSEVEAGDPDKHENSLHEKPTSWNEINFAKEEESNDVPGNKKDYLSKANLLKDKRLDVSSGYDHLEGLTAKGPNIKEFVEPKVEGLWKLALDANFSRDELNSLKEELLHYETRLRKLRHLHTEEAIIAARNGKDYEPNKSSNSQVKRQALNVEKLHNKIQDKIMSKHTEL